MNSNFKIIIVMLCFSPFINKGLGQTNFVREDGIIVLNTVGDTLKNPWAGGFNSVQFSEIDLNLDGIKDLFVFDRTGNRISTFINAGTPNQVNYKHDPSYISNFPSKLTDWVLLRDYNCDGKMDIFTYSTGGIAAYKNTSTTQLNFTLDTNLIYSDYQPDAAPNFINLYVSSTDIPAIDDIDGDGDLDILTFSILGSYVEYHKNLSIEKNGNCNSLDFQLRNKCWGFFRENLSGNSVTIYDTCSFNNANPEKSSGGNKHAGSMLFTLDVDSNGTKDLVTSDVSFNNFTLLINSDTSSNKTASTISTQDYSFPANNMATLPIDINIFPAGFYLDVDNDTIKDLIAAPNCYNGCKNSDNVWYYKNDNANDKPDFNFVTESFLQNGMIELGEGAHPVFFDYNVDGLMDIIIGGYGRFDIGVGPLMYESGLWVYENVGTANSPVYQLVTTDYAGISTMNLDIAGARPTLGLVPSFGDLDGDNDLDMILGDYLGKIHYFDNTAGPGNPPVFTLAAPEFFNIDVGADATPFLYDINGDLLLDLIIGKKIGTFSYYRNIGTAFSPNYTLSTDSLGKATTRRYLDFNGNSCPILIDSMGTTFLYSGAQNGYVYKFGNIDGNLNGTFSVLDSSLSNIWEGINSYITMADVTNDGRLDMLVGNYAGGVAFYEGDFGLSVNTADKLTEFSLYPNPTNCNINIDFGDNNLINAQLNIIDVLGKVVYSQSHLHKKLSIDLSNNAKGIYLIKFSNPTGCLVYKVIKK